jgi:antitoxin (DNA-binding transcriptional repressor) of toxin-antitoxin stability system
MDGARCLVHAARITHHVLRATEGLHWRLESARGLLQFPRMNTVTLEQAQAKLPELLHCLPAGGELFITEQGAAAAKMVRLPFPEAGKGQRVPRFGFGRGQIELKPGWDEPDDEFPPDKL